MEEENEMNENQELNLICTKFLSLNNHYLGHRAIMQNLKGKSQPMVVVYEMKEAKDFKKEFVPYVMEEIEKNKWQKVSDRQVILDATFYMPRKRMDCNNLWKILIDCLTESGIWNDDDQCLERAKRIYIDSNNPRIEIKLTVAPFIGIFDNKEDLNEFKIKCEQCKRFKRNCSILNNAIDGRIQPEIENKVCSKFIKIKER